jgi:hypothetical protein
VHDRDDRRRPGDGAGEPLARPHTLRDPPRDDPRRLREHHPLPRPQPEPAEHVSVGDGQAGALSACSAVSCDRFRTCETRASRRWASRCTLAPSPACSRLQNIHLSPTGRQAGQVCTLSPSFVCNCTGQAQGHRIDAGHGVLRLTRQRRCRRWACTRPTSGSAWTRTAMCCTTLRSHSRARARCRHATSCPVPCATPRSHSRARTRCRRATFCPVPCTNPRSHSRGRARCRRATSCPVPCTTPRSRSRARARCRRATACPVPCPTPRSHTRARTRCRRAAARVCLGLWCLVLLHRCADTMQTKCSRAAACATRLHAAHAACARVRWLVEAAALQRCENCCAMATAQAAAACVQVSAREHVPV